MEGRRPRCGEFSAAHLDISLVDFRPWRFNDEAEVQLRTVVPALHNGRIDRNLDEVMIDPITIANDAPRDRGIVPVGRGFGPASHRFMCFHRKGHRRNIVGTGYRQHDISVGNAVGVEIGRKVFRQVKIDQTPDRLAIPAAGKISIVEPNKKVLARPVIRQRIGD